MPSYIFVRMRMDKNLWNLISNMQYVVAFVGASSIYRVHLYLDKDLWNHTTEYSLRIDFICTCPQASALVSS